MHRIGPANWAMPSWLDRIVPNLSIEAEDDPADTPQVKEPPGSPTDSDDPSEVPQPAILAMTGGPAPAIRRR